MENWKYFSEKELACRGTGKTGMDAHFMERLIALREEYDKPIIISSAYRTQEYNNIIGGVPNSAHTFGRAVDIRASYSNAYELVCLAMKYEFTGIGINQKGIVSGRFIHLDDMEHEYNDVAPRPTVWSY